MPELIPVVDKNDRVRKYLPSRIIHAHELQHREIAVYLINTARQILVQKRDGGYLDHSVAGHVRKGETYVQAALREIKEEVGLNLKPRDLKRLGKFYHRTLSPQKGYYNNRFFTLYVVRHPVELKDVRINKREMEDLKPMSVNKIKTIMRRSPQKCKGGFLVSFPLLIKHHNFENSIYHNIAQSKLRMKEQCGCFFCRAPQLQTIKYRGTSRYKCPACKKTSTRFHELYGPTKVRSTPAGPVHFSAGALIERNRKYLIMKRAVWPRLWATIGGHVDKGETMAQALAREVKEETGLTIKDKHLIFKGMVDPDRCYRGVDRHFWHLYLVHVEGSMKRHPREATKLQWLTKQQMARLKFTLPVHYVLKKLKFFAKRK